MRHPQIGLARLLARAWIAVISVVSAIKFAIMVIATVWHKVFIDNSGIGKRKMVFWAILATLTLLAASGYYALPGMILATLAFMAIMAFTTVITRLYGIVDNHGLAYS